MPTNTDLRDVYQRLNANERQIAQHEAACAVRNKSQEEFNVRIEQSVSVLSTIVTNMRIRMALIAGAAAAGGGTVGSLIASMLK